FFASSKKVGKERRPQTCPSGDGASVITFCALQKMGNRRNSPAAQTTSVSDPFSVKHKMQRPKRG
ncbi:MAG: hypothetical protein V4488_08300, partial [Pseudomonadota bacterium]